MGIPFVEFVPEDLWLFMIISDAGNPNLFLFDASPIKQYEPMMFCFLDAFRQSLEETNIPPDDDWQIFESQECQKWCLASTVDQSICCHHDIGQMIAGRPVKFFVHDPLMASSSSESQEATSRA